MPRNRRGKRSRREKLEAPPPPRKGRG
ncbi:unnamed protein product [Spirodela intermedia]|uniref:Uncharacterized protein n=1 Tax=Spirodela intermedia TaxID=51605 RepID=A0A7I8KNN4_SPIIN|nr:unnamed protein product [Spirodela intermedia]